MVTAWLLGPGDDLGVEVLALVEAIELPHREPEHERDPAEAEQVERDPFRGAAGTGTSR